MQIKVKNPFLDFLWKSDAAVEFTTSPGCLCAYVTWCEASGSQQAITTHPGLCLWKEVCLHNSNAEFALWPGLSQLLISIFLNLLIHNGLLQGCQCWRKLGFEAGHSRAWSCKVHHWRGKEHEHRKVHRWKEEEQRQVWPNACPGKLSYGQKTGKPEIRVYVGRQTLDSDTNVRPPCDNLQGNSCHVHMIGGRICLLVTDGNSYCATLPRICLED